MPMKVGFERFLIYKKNIFVAVQQNSATFSLNFPSKPIKWVLVKNCGSMCSCFSFSSNSDDIHLLY